MHDEKLYLSRRIFHFLNTEKFRGNLALVYQNVPRGFDFDSFWSNMTLTSHEAQTEIRHFLQDGSS
jgi:hypothetical protein